jgi:hypothetical protein
VSGKKKPGFCRDCGVSVERGSRCERHRVVARECHRARRLALGMRPRHNSCSCTICGQTGHDRRTCEQPPPAMLIKPVVCSNCGQVGHNRRTCSVSSLRHYKRHYSDLAACSRLQRQGATEAPER